MVAMGDFKNAYNSEGAASLDQNIPTTFLFFWYLV
jgi:hypothetical protein